MSGSGKGMCARAAVNSKFDAEGSSLVEEESKF